MLTCRTYAMEWRLATFASITSLQTRSQNNSGKRAGLQHKSLLSTVGENDIDDSYDHTVQQAAAVVSRDKELELCGDEIADRDVNQNVMPLRIALAQTYKNVGRPDDFEKLRSDVLEIRSQ